MKKLSRALIGSLAISLALSALPAAVSAKTVLKKTSAPSSASDYWQCVPFARLISGIQIFGDAWTWWGQAAGKYETGDKPQTGSVLVFKSQGVMKLGHVAVVSKVQSDRIVQVTHANWSVIDGSRGQVENDVTMIDVSPDNDWSQVKVWFDPADNLGSTVYKTYGFIYQDDAAQHMAAANSTIAMASGAALSVIQAAAGKALDAVNPAAAPLKVLTDSGDKIGALIQQIMGGGSSSPAQ
ncbi:MAG: domain containing protein [Caulobacteraceae bacterium]|nr:domain containing protein [Caulobacteraceae bacterium]